MKLYRNDILFYFITAYCYTATVNEKNPVKYAVDIEYNIKIYINIK